MSRMQNGVDARRARERFTDEELDELARELRRRGVMKALPDGAPDVVEELFADVDDAALDELLERLDEAGGRADVWLPVAFAGEIALKGIRCASTHALLAALESLREDLELDADPSERDPRLVEQRNLWKRFRAGAKLATEKGLVLDLIRF